MSYSRFPSFLFVSALVFLCLPMTAVGADLQYAEINEINPDTLSITYTSPDGDSHFVCQRTTDECSERSSVPHVRPGTTNPEANFYWSPQNTYAVSEQPLRVFDKYLYTIYRNTGDSLESVGYLPYFEKTTKLRFSQDESRLFLSAADGTAISVPTSNPQQAHTVNLNEEALGQWVLSPDGRLIAGYAAGEASGTYEVVVQSLTTEEAITVATSVSSAYHNIAINAANNSLAYVDVKDGNRVLKVKSLTEPQKPADIVFDKQWIDSLATAGGNFFVVANAADDPYTYNLHEYDPQANTLQTVERNVASEFFPHTTQNSVFFGVLDGPTRHVARYDTKSGGVDIYNPVQSDDTLDRFDLKRSTVEINDKLSAALVTPFYTDPEKVLVWLHGGPHRQTSPGYNPSPVYGVYDELLDAFARAGWAVLKLDYTGSTGYSASFMNDISGSIGTQDVRDTKAAIDWADSNLDSPDISLMGVSYGGYLSLKTAVEHPQEVGKTVSVNGVTDWLTDTLIDPTFRSYFDGRPSPETIDNYMTSSLIYDLDELKDTPSLILQSTEDRTVDPVQAALFDRLAGRASIPHTYTTIDGASHILQKREHLDVLCQNVADFFAEEDLCSLR